MPGRGREDCWRACADCCDRAPDRQMLDDDDRPITGLRALRASEFF
jgi:hypothetical protein